MVSDAAQCKSKPRRIRFQSDPRPKNVIVTCGFKSIGRGIAQVFAVQGKKVTLKKVCKDMGDNVRCKIADMGGWDAMKVVVKSTAKAQGALDIMCANAGYFLQSMVVDMDVEEWYKVMACNLRSSFLAVKASISYVEKRAEVA